MAYVDTGNHVFASTSGAVSKSATLTGTTAGNLVVVGCISDRGGGPQPTLLVTDDKGNSYTNEGVSYADPNAASISWSKITTGGSLLLTLSGNGANSYALTLFAREFQNPHASPASGSATGSTGTGVTADTTAVTPADNDPLVIAVACSHASGTITENVSPGDSGWTLSDEDEISTDDQPGSMVFKIIVGTPGTPRAAWTIPSGTWATRIKAFKPAASGGSSSVSPSVSPSVSLSPSPSASQSASPSPTPSSSPSPSPAGIIVMERTVFDYID